MSRNESAAAPPNAVTPTKPDFNAHEHMSSARGPRPEPQLAADVLKAKLGPMFGCKAPETALTLLRELLRVDHSIANDPERATTALVDTIALVVEFAPATGPEAMVSTQAAATHRAAMTLLARAMQPASALDASDRDRDLGRAIRLMSLFAEQLDAIAKLKGTSGQQRVIVEHVHVGAGGQAIIGAVQGGRGNGRNGE